MTSFEPIFYYPKGPHGIRGLPIRYACFIGDVKMREIMDLEPDNIHFGQFLQKYGDKSPFGGFPVLQVIFIHKLQN